MLYDVIIIGAGMSGIAAGIRLAYYEKNVCILEKHCRPGGLNSFYNLDGRKFDVGLHAMTNYVPKGTKNTPLAKLLKQLKLKYEDFDLCRQESSAIVFPQKTLRFTNDFHVLDQEIIEKFPLQKDNFHRLYIYISDYNELDLNIKPVSAREVVGSFITDPLLVEMLLCPLSYYGSAKEDDMDFDQFVIMFKSIFLEGFARPEKGVRKIIDVLLKKYKECGGYLRLKTGVESINQKDGKVRSVTLENGEVLEADKVLSSAGYVETMRLAGEDVADERIGKLSFVEMIYILDRDPAELGIENTIIFYNDSEKFSYRKPDDPVDLSSGVICCPNNFKFENPLPEGIVRTTHMANFDMWRNPGNYQEQKEIWRERSLEKIRTIVPDFSSHIIFTDMFTPITIKRFTGHLDGAVYGSPRKIKNGITPVKNLFICGTDQGFMGIVGACLSGISMANLHALR
jgi:phytoene dehydrogenase-like protein